MMNTTFAISRWDTLAGHPVLSFSRHLKYSPSHPPGYRSSKGVSHSFIVFRHAFHLVHVPPLFCDFLLIYCTRFVEGELLFFDFMSL